MSTRTTSTASSSTSFSTDPFILKKSVAVGHYENISAEALYPPNGDQQQEETSSKVMAREIVGQLCLDDKLALLSGHSLWELAGSVNLQRQHDNDDDASTFFLPNLFLCDGPHGLRKPISQMGLLQSHPSTCFPTAAALACSWNPTLLSEVVGPALSRECYAQGVSILLGPGLNLKRHAAGGRNFEYFSEDPILSGNMARALVKGIQASGRTGACLKHYCINNQESHRFVVNAIVDERTARELYLRNFEIAINNDQHQPAMIMTAYNRINGTFASEHKELIQNVLRHEFNYQGVVVTDWGATDSRASGIAAGVDVEMPGSCGAHDRTIATALQNDTLLENHVDECCRRVVELILKYKNAAILQKNKDDDDDDDEDDIDFDSHHELAYRAALECVVLLQNKDNLLPLKSSSSSSSLSSSGTILTSVAVIGAFGKDAPRYQGMGSSQVNCARQPTCLYDEVKRHCHENSQEVYYAKGYCPNNENDSISNNNDDPDAITQSLLIDEAVQVAQKADVVLLCIGLPEIMESEGFDRTTLCLPRQHDRLAQEICNVHANVVVVLSNGGAVQLPDSFFCCDTNNTSVNNHAPKAILEGYLLGQAGAKALADLIFGVQSPSGKLTETMPVRMQDVPADAYFPGCISRVEHREGLDVGYRYLDTANVPVRFPFGHGLSYTTFEYSNLQARVVVDEKEDKKVQVSFEVTNSGSNMAGSEVAQCYVRDDHASVYRPSHELRQFQKVDLLQAGESTTVTFELDKMAFAFYDIGYCDWVVEQGSFEIQIGSSSRDIRLTTTIEFETGREASALAKESYPPCTDGGTLAAPIDDEIFAKRFGRDCSNVLEEIRLRKQQQEGTVTLQDRFHRNSLLKEVAAVSWIGSFLRYIVYYEASKEIQTGPAQRRQQRMMQENVDNLPLRTLVLFSRGNLSFDTMDALTAAMNGKYLLSMDYAAKATAALVADTFSAVCGRPYETKDKRQTSVSPINLEDSV